MNMLNGIVKILSVTVNMHVFYVAISVSDFKYCLNKITTPANHP